MTSDINLIPLTRDLALRTGEDPCKAGLILPGSDVATLVRDVARAQLALYDRTRTVEPWIGYFGSSAETGEVIGSCSFVGPPRDGFVEIAYFTFPHAEGRGFARSMAAGLVSLTQSHAPFPKVFAHTLPERNASASVLDRIGFRHVGDAIDDEVGRVWRWEAS
ncbi:GNAT family N-acetyltransferase [Rubellimicrobium arenae]|uniref:GNAT family N-acetyltransferase n=1 Tax=Rubellimicrobium arenae TaxID=2817372 RepID=UPI001B3078EB|nr:GNAT family N-acetyltransferase [Rubellimicrobium arenae]